MQYKQLNNPKLMGSCVTGQRVKNVRYMTHTPSALKDNEIELLELMFNDLADRASSKQLTRENFEVFFHMSGLWGQEIFTRFDTKKLGRLDFEDFRKGICTLLSDAEYLVKGDFEQRVHALFQFYNIHKTNGISYEQLLKMLYSYPKEQLKKVIDDEKFLNAMNPQERYYHFGKARVLDDAREVVEEVQDQSSTEHDSWRKDKMASDMPNVEAYCPELEPQKKPSNKQKEKKSSQKIVGSVLFKASVEEEPERKPEKKRSGSISYFDPKKNFKVSSNISLVVKKYATFLFKQFKLDKENDELSEPQFLTLIEKHKKIFTSYFEGFHNYVWQINQQNIPLSKIEDCWIQSNCQEINFESNKSCSRFIRFVRTTLFIYSKPSDAMPIQIKNLQGLLVQQFNRGVGERYQGFIIKHRDGLYPQSAYLFDSTHEKDLWMKHLKHFKNNSIYDLVQLQERIGAGNYSVVYKGCEKISKCEVAVKVIEKMKLTEGENEVIKHECSILQLCHHPCVIKFKNKIESKTQIFIVTEYMNEGMLYQYVRKRGFLEEYEASLIMKQLIQTVLYLNSLSLIHRDLKAENILVRLNKKKDLVQRVKIIDFGFAIFQESMKALHPREKFAGTPGYLAPQVLLLKEYDETVDNFSLGVIMYFMLSGILPFHSIIPQEVVNLTLRCNVSLKNAHWTNISDHGKDLVARLLNPKEERILLEDAIKHPWITEREELLANQGKNKRKPRKL